MHVRYRTDCNNDPNRITCSQAESTNKNFRNSFSTGLAFNLLPRQTPQWKKCWNQVFEPALILCEFGSTSESEAYKTRLVPKCANNIILSIEDHESLSFTSQAFFSHLSTIWILGPRVRSVLPNADPDLTTQMNADPCVSGSTIRLEQK